MDKKMSLEQVRDALRMESGTDTPKQVAGVPTVYADMQVWADAIDAEIRARGEPKAWLVSQCGPTVCSEVFSTRAEADECADAWDYPSIEPLFAVPPAPKITDARIIEIAADVATRTVFANIESPLILDIVRAALEAALKETP